MIKQQPNQDIEKSKKKAANTPNKVPKSASEDLKLPEAVQVLDRINQESLQLLAIGKDNPNRWIQDTLESRASIMDFLILKIMMAYFFNICRPKFYYSRHNIICVKKKSDCTGFEKPEEIRPLLLQQKDEEAITKKRRELLKSRKKEEKAYRFLKGKSNEIFNFFKGLNLRRMSDFVEFGLPRNDGKVQLPLFKITLNFSALGYKASEGDETDPLSDLQTLSPVKNLKKQKITSAVCAPKKNSRKEEESNSPVKRLKVDSPQPESSSSRSSQEEDDESNPSSATRSLNSSRELQTPEDERIAILVNKLKNLALIGDKGAEKSSELIKTEPPYSSEEVSDGNESFSSVEEQSKNLKKKLADQHLEQIQTLQKFRALKQKKLTRVLNVAQEVESDIKMFDSQIAFLKKARRSINGKSDVVEEKED